MRDYVQSTARNIDVFLADSSDHVTGKTGLTLTIKSSKAGAGFATITPSVTELESGWYKLALTSGMVDTLGDLAFHVTATGADPSDWIDQVVAYNHADSVRLGLTALPNAAAAASGGLPTFGTSTGQLNPSGGKVPATIATGDIADIDATRAAKIDNLNATVSSRMATYTQPTGFLAATFPSDPADASDIAAAFAAVAGQVWSNGTRTLSAGTNIVLAKGVGVTGFTDITAADVWAVGSRTITGTVTLANGAHGGAAATINFGDGFFASSSAFGSITGDLPSAFITAVSLAGDVSTLISTQVATDLATAHGDGSWEGGAGIGDILVTQDTGGTDNLQATDSNGVGVECIITAFLSSEYVAGATARGQARTGTNGRWLNPMMLSAGTYTFVFDTPDRPAYSVEQEVA